MSEVPPLNTGFLLGMVATVLFAVAYPLVLAVLAHRHLHGGLAISRLRCGCLLRVPAGDARACCPAHPGCHRRPAQSVDHAHVGRGSWRSPSRPALFEEVGRYVGYRVFMRREEKTWSKAVMYGLGHGGLESFVLVGGLTLLGAVNSGAWPTADWPSYRTTSGPSRRSNCKYVNSQPGWVALLSAWERLWTVPIQVGFSVIVLQVFRRGRMIWLLWAVLGHAFVDLVAVGLQQLLGTGLGALLVIEGVVAIFGLIAVWIIWRLRESPARSASPGSESLAPQLVTA